MATLPPLIKFLMKLPLLLVVVAAPAPAGTAADNITQGHHHDIHFHTIHINSFFQILQQDASSVCRPSTSSQSHKSPSTLEVFHRHGPCSPLQKDDRTGTLSLSEILSADQSSVQSIQAHHALRGSNPDKFITTMKVDIPLQSGRSLGIGLFVVQIGLGTPKRMLTMLLDTGSSLAWTQCQPCSGSCYQQKDSIFDPSSSSSYSNVSCNSPECPELASAMGEQAICADTTCAYRIAYGDGSSSTGFFSKETLTLTPDDVFPNILLACGQDNSGMFGKAAGVLGLSGDPMSIISQTSQKYNKYFSYCLPSSPSSAGRLTMGKTESSTQGVQFTPFSSSHWTSSLYYIDIVGISVGGDQLPIDPKIFKTSGSVIDSGTVITRLPPVVYNMMSQAFKQAMNQYPQAPSVSLLDTCYDLSNATTVSIPKIVFTFAGNVSVDLHSSGILITISRRQVCLAFTGNKNDTTLAIFGNTQQKELEVVYDVAGENIGFRKGCELEPTPPTPTPTPKRGTTSTDSDMCLPAEIMYMVH